MGMHRRLFSLLLLKGVAGASLSGLSMPESSEYMLEKIISDILSEIPSARTIGMACIREGVKVEPIPRNTINDLVRLCRSPPFYDHRKVSYMMKRLIRSDYDANRILVVDGWVLSQMEARLCILALHV